MDRRPSLPVAHQPASNGSDQIRELGPRPAQGGWPWPTGCLRVLFVNTPCVTISLPSPREKQGKGQGGFRCHSCDLGDREAGWNQAPQLNKPELIKLGVGRQRTEGGQRASTSGCPVPGLVELGAIRGTLQVTISSGPREGPHPPKS